MYHPVRGSCAELGTWLNMYIADVMRPEFVERYIKSVAESITQQVPTQHSETECFAFKAQEEEDNVLRVLESFICGGANGEQVLEQLKRNGFDSSVCGRVFKIGEPTYSCRECSTDPTCVLCSSCFKKSTHRMHKYKMATSSGGGCCDCGDTEAWKKDPVCEDHASISDQSMSSESTSKIPEDVRGRAKLAFQAVVNYCMRVLKMDSDGAYDEDEDDDENTHCTVLYNDETHTFEQVIQALTSIVRCPQKTAIEYVTSIDREGRAVVKCASFEVCKKLKEDIENKAIRTSVGGRLSPLKVTVMHRKEVACQQLAITILGWFQEFLSKHSEFRSIFADHITNNDTVYNLKVILGNDHKLWKSARSCWHRLLISGMLMEYNNKKTLAVTFTRLYALLMQAFVRDDHYHSFSIVSLGVQLFTVPTIAHYLIEEESAFFKLQHTFYTEAIEKYIKNRQLQFARNTSTMNVFKRASYILIDLKYLLSFKPYSWTNSLRTGFLHGVQALIRLLKCMQGMDAVTRQIGQHMEYEPEWETAFALHVKLSHLITLVLDWCATDRLVLIKVYRMVLNALTDVKFIIPETEPVVCEVADHSASCLAYDVASKPVSVHLPLTRFLAGLYTAFERHDVPFVNETHNHGDHPTPEQIIQPVLCTRAMISQVHAGLWRRNGYALLNQLYFYRSVKCRYEMLDRDIVILQQGATLIEANEFIIHVLHKFNLLGWIANDQVERPARTGDETGSSVEDDNLRQTTILVEELLELLIIVVGERHVPGVGDVSEGDRIKKEIVQQLCIKPHSHSELGRALNEENCSETAIESLIDAVAVFEKPNTTDKKGVFKLKPEYYSWYNLYYYHYSKEEKSKSEEAQRSRRKEKGDLVCCPPPDLPKLTISFSILSNLLQCDVMLEIVRIVLTRALDLKSVSFSEGQLQRVLHLIGYAIQEEETGYYPYMKFLERSQKIGLLAMLDELAKSPRVESQRDLLRWVIQRYKALDAAQKKKACIGQEERSAGEEASGCGSGSSGEGASTQQQEMDAERLEKEQRAKLAAVRRAQVLAQMQNMQQSFMKSNKALFQREEEEAAAAETLGMVGTGSLAEEAAVAVDSDVEMEWESDVASNSAPKPLICIGSNRTAGRGPFESGSWYTPERHTCILCSEESVLTTRNRSMVYAAFVQRSSVLSRYQQTDESGQLQYIETVIHPSPHISTCGHVMHSLCFEKYFNNEVMKEHRRPYRSRMPILFDIEKREFLCPLCRCLSNCLLPLLPQLDSIIYEAEVTGTPSSHLCTSSSSTFKMYASISDVNFDFRSWYAFMKDFLHLMQKQLPKLEAEEEPAEEGGEPPEDDLSTAAISLELTDMSDVLEEVRGDSLHVLVRHLLETLYPRRRVVTPPSTEETPNSAHDEESVPSDLFNVQTYLNLLKFCLQIGDQTAAPPKAKYFAQYLSTWLACSYTIKSLEMLLRVMERPFGVEMSIRHESCLRGLVRVACVLGAIMPGRKYHKSMIGYAVDLYETLFGLKPSNSFFEWDLFGILNTCLFATRYVLFQAVPHERIPRGDGLDQAIVQAVFLFNVLRTVVTSTAGTELDGETSPPNSMDTTDSETPSVSQQERGSNAATAAEAEQLTPAESTLLRLYRLYNIYYQPAEGEVEEPFTDAEQHGDRPARSASQAQPKSEPPANHPEAEASGEPSLAEESMMKLAEEKPPQLKVEPEPKQQEKEQEQQQKQTSEKLHQRIGGRRLCQALLRDIRTQSQTLLRCCCLLFHIITDVELPDDPAVEGETADEASYRNMVTYLGLPVDPLSYFEPREPSLALITRLASANADNIWQMRWVRKEQLLGSRPLFHVGPPVRQLIVLPEDYSDLIDSVSLFTCPNNVRDDSRNPTMCLVCGAVLCSQSFCCQRELDKVLVGSCTYHTAECGAGIGIFLRIRDAEILLLGINKGCFIPAPYLDEYGETDQGLRRGNPLRLCKERYRKLHLAWLSHGLHEEITRRNESQQTLFATQWQNL